MPESTAYETVTPDRHPSRVFRDPDYAQQHLPYDPARHDRRRGRDVSGLLSHHRADALTLLLTAVVLGGSCYLAWVIGQLLGALAGFWGLF